MPDRQRNRKGRKGLMARARVFRVARSGSTRESGLLHARTNLAQSNGDGKSAWRAQRKRAAGTPAPVVKQKYCFLSRRRNGPSGEYRNEVCPVGCRSMKV